MLLERLLTKPSLLGLLLRLHRVSRKLLLQRLLLGESCLLRLLLLGESCGLRCERAGVLLLLSHVAVEAALSKGLLLARPLAVAAHKGVRIGKHGCFDVDFEFAWAIRAPLS